MIRPKRVRACARLYARGGKRAGVQRWLPAYSQVALQSGLRLLRLDPDMLPRRIVAGDVDQLDQAREPSPFALRGEGRGPAVFVIFVVPPAAAMPRLERFDPCGETHLSDWTPYEQEGRSEAHVDPMPVE